MVLRRPETSATNGFFFNLFNVFMSKKHVHHVFMSKNMYLMSSCLKKHVHHVFMSKNMYLMSKYDICIPNAQYSSLSAQQNLWCEILEF